MASQQLLTRIERQPFAYTTVASLVRPNSVRGFAAPNGSLRNPFLPTFTPTAISVVIALFGLAPRRLRETRRCAEARSEEREGAA